MEEVVDEGRGSSSWLSGREGERRSTPEFQLGQPEPRSSRRLFFTVYSEIPLNQNVQFNGGLFLWKTTLTLQVQSGGIKEAELKAILYKTVKSALQLREFVTFQIKQTGLS